MTTVPVARPSRTGAAAIALGVAALVVSITAMVLVVVQRPATSSAQPAASRTSPTVLDQLRWRHVQDMDPTTVAAHFGLAG